MSASGFLNVLKPPGMTSHDVVARVRRRFPRKTKVGHLGTLDPAAAGVLPIAVGGATRLIPLQPDLGGRMKSYLGHIQLGTVTSTDDLEGEVLRQADTRAITRAQVEDALQPFRGAIEQIPPQVSALRLDGQRAYERVRKGQVVELKARPVLVDELTLLDYSPETAVARVHLVCGSGTYVRSIARDLGEALGVGGTLAFLLRTHSGAFHLSQAVTLEELWQEGEAALLPCSYPFTELPRAECEPLKQKGQLVQGEFARTGLYLAPQGLLRAEAGNSAQAVVVALFAGLEPEGTEAG